MAEIDRNNPFTWILTVNCGKQILQDCRAQADKQFATGVYLLPDRFRLGIVIIEQLPSTSETLWLKMLGNRESARSAFSAIDRLTTPDRIVRNDIMAACWKYCVYLKDLDIESLTSEESEFMKTMEELDALYEAEMNRARLEGKLEGALEGEQRQQEAIALNLLRENVPLEIISRTTGLSIDRLQQLRTN